MSEVSVQHGTGTGTVPGTCAALPVVQIVRERLQLFVFRFPLLIERIMYLYVIMEFLHMFGPTADAITYEMVSPSVAREGITTVRRSLYLAPACLSP